MRGDDEDEEQAGFTTVQRRRRRRRPKVPITENTSRRVQGAGCRVQVLGRPPSSATGLVHVWIKIIGGFVSVVFYMGEYASQLLPPGIHLPKATFLSWCKSSAIHP